MKSLRQAIQKSWFPEMKIISGDLATSLQLAKPLSLTELTRHLDQPEVKTVRSSLDADALHGEARNLLCEAMVPIPFVDTSVQRVFRRLPIRSKWLFDARQA